MVLKIDWMDNHLGGWRATELILRRYPMNRIAGLAFLVLSLVGTSSLWAVSEKEKASVRYKAVTMLPKTARSSPAVQLDILVDRLTSDSERMEYLQLLKEKGEEAMLKTLAKVNVGRISTPGQVGVAVAVARVRDTEGGQRVRLVTTRPVSFLQARRGEMADQFPYTVMDLYLDADGKGNGTVLSALRVFFDDDGQLQIQGLGGDPVDLINVERVQ